MKHTIIFVWGSLLCNLAFCQGDFPYGSITMQELEMTHYEKDSSAAAVVLHEFGKAYIDHEYRVVYEYHAKIKILSEAGLREGTCTVPLYAVGNLPDKMETVTSFQGTTYNLEAKRMIATPFDTKTAKTEGYDKRHRRMLYPLPRVKVGSVIEIKYQTMSPFLIGFQSWMFQDDIPKAYSEFWAQIPANFIYTITLRGFQKLKSNTVERVPQCFQMVGTASTGYDSDKSDCSLAKYSMEYIPALAKEPFTGSARNYRSAVYFELADYIDHNGVHRKLATEWKDVEETLDADGNFGGKIKRGKKYMEPVIGPLVATEHDAVKRTMIVHRHIQKRFRWNGENEKYTDVEIKKSYETGQGSSADINLSLISALQAAGLPANPVLLSTRDNGVAPEYPQSDDFNYVIASVKIGDTRYLLDATDSLLAFGVLPMHCLNQKGRLLGPEPDWLSLKQTARQRIAIKMEATLDDEGSVKGKMSIEHFDYSARDLRDSLRMRRKGYLLRQASLVGINATEYTVDHMSDVSRSVVERANVQIVPTRAADGTTYITPFIVSHHVSNPLKARERLFPVDYGTPVEMSYFISLDVSSKFAVKELPQNVIFTLPQGGGKCLLNVTRNGNKITLSSVVSLMKPLYEPAEYPYLRDFYDRVIALQQSVIVVKQL